MKNTLIKFLLPVSAIVTTTVPFASSCNQKPTFKPTFTYEVSTEWKPTIQPKESDDLVISEATNTYLLDAKQNPRIFADDCMASKIQKLIDRNVEHVTISILDINTSKKIVSIKFATSSHEDGSLWCYENTISNMPVEVTYDNATSTWNLKHNTTEYWLKNNEDWSTYSQNLKDGVVQEDSKKTDNHETVQSSWEMDRVVNKLNEFMVWNSYYLKQMTPK